MSKSIVIIGAGLAGYMLAKEFRKLNQTAALTLVTQAQGHFYSKPQLSNALAKEQSLASLVLTDVGVMREQLNAQIITEQTVTRINAEDKSIDLADSQVIEYDQLVLAHGAEPIAARFAGDAVDQMSMVNQLEDYVGFRKQLEGKKTIAIIGTGLVGCEFMNDLLTAGFEVDMYSLDHAPLAFFIPPQLGETFKEIFAGKDVTMYMQQPVQAINKVKGQLQVETVQANRTYDAVLSAIGLIVNKHLAESAQLVVNKAIEVNRYLQTSDPHIYALGDCASVDGINLQYIAPLLQCARTLAKILTDDKQKLHYPVMPVVIKTPLCPVVTVPPLSWCEGGWTITGEGADWTALHHDARGQLTGFSLLGACIKERMQYVKAMQPIWMA